MAKLIHTARLVNDGKPEWVIGKVNEAVIEALQQDSDKKLADIKIACLGLAFKPDIDDLRESPALKITEKLAEKYPNQVLAVEPNVEELPAKLADKGIELVQLDDALTVADVLVILVDHKEFKGEQLVDVKGLVVDTKGIFK